MVCWDRLTPATVVALERTEESSKSEIWKRFPALPGKPVLRLIPANPVVGDPSITIIVFSQRLAPDLMEEPLMWRGWKSSVPALPGKPALCPINADPMVHGVPSPDVLRHQRLALQVVERP